MDTVWQVMTSTSTFFFIILNFNKSHEFKWENNTEVKVKMEFFQFTYEVRGSFTSSSYDSVLYTFEFIMQCNSSGKNPISFVSKCEQNNWRLRLKIPWWCFLCSLQPRMNREFLVQFKFKSYNIIAYFFISLKCEFGDSQSTQ